jgi:hypothetical protein
MANKTSKSAEGYFAKYKTSGKEAKNRLAKLERQLKLQPSNEAQITLAIKNIHHRRKTPVTPYWSHSMINTARLMKAFTGKFDKLAFHPDPKNSEAALKTRNANKFTTGEMLKLIPPLPKNYNAFSLGTRVRVIQWK